MKHLWRDWKSRPFKAATGLRGTLEAGSRGLPLAGRIEV